MWRRGGIQSGQLKGILRTPKTVGEVDALLTLLSLYPRKIRKGLASRLFSGVRREKYGVKVIDLHAARAGLDFPSLDGDLPNDLRLADTH